ncbi:MAG: adenylosuccinate synthase [Zoogloeaceae bacterium]|jgi:adenylosuccinate synthase|nr:adenylosuccinate synthase [Zoogloeaceae bacterium]
MARNVVVVGTQWGDEGKGKIVDWLTGSAAGVVRFQGGHNAGHTLVVGCGEARREYKLNLVPSGIVHPGIQCYIGNGVVLDIQHLLKEIDALEKGGIEVCSRLHVSPGCALILPYHAALDQAREAKRDPAAKIGTTGKGIGPAYEDKVARRGIKVHDLFEQKRLAEKLAEALDYHNFTLTRYLGAGATDYRATLDLALACGERLKPMVTDVSAALHAMSQAGENLLFEGAQGTLLDIDHGTYPFVTSSTCVAGQAAAGAGIGPNLLHYVLGVTKAYCTRVGGGPFPSELDIETEGAPGHQLSKKGREFGTVTGRARRCGWFDAAALRRSALINGLSGLCITKLDVLDGLETLNICVGYRLDGERVDLLPMGADEVARCEPVFETLPGWTERTNGLQRWEDLPQNARAYLERLEQLCRTPIAIVSTGPERAETILRQHPFD